MPEALLTETTWAAIVVNYNAGEHLKACIASILSDDSAGSVPEVIVVDNDSTDGSADGLELAEPSVQVIRAGANLGYATAANLGIAASRAPIVAVINPDATVQYGTAKAMLGRFTSEPRLGASGPRVFNPDGTVYPSARSLPSPLIAAGHGVLGLVWADNPATRRYRQLNEDPAIARDVDWVSGAAIWLRRTALDAVGNWDEEFFMYVEDVDLCWRLRRAGWRIAYEPGGNVTHIGGVSTNAKPYAMILEHHRSMWRFAKKRWSGPRSVMLAPAAVFLAGRAGLALANRAASGATKGARRGSN